MKYVIMIIALFVLNTTANAQSVVTMSLVAGDTLTNADTVDKYLPQLSGGYAGVAISPFITKASGTAAGKVYLYESSIAVTPGTYSQTSIWGLPVDSMTLTDATYNTKMFHRAAPAANFYRLQYVSSGTTVLYTRTRYCAKIFQITP